jgi:hypothetical protein
MIIRRTERLRMNILSILSILVAVSNLRKMKMLKMFKVLKKIIRQNLSGLLGASTVSQTARAAIYMIQMIRIGVIEEYTVPPPHQRNGSGAGVKPPNTPVVREAPEAARSLTGEKRDIEPSDSVDLGLVVFSIGF